MADITVSITIPDALVARVSTFVRACNWDGKDAIGDDASAAQVRARAKEVVAFMLRRDLRAWELSQPDASLDQIT